MAESAARSDECAARRRSAAVEAPLGVSGYRIDVSTHEEPRSARLEIALPRDLDRRRRQPGAAAVSAAASGRRVFDHLQRRAHGRTGAGAEHSRDQPDRVAAAALHALAGRLARRERSDAFRTLRHDAAGRRDDQVGGPTIAVPPPTYAGAAPLVPLRYGNALPLPLPSRRSDRWRTSSRWRPVPLPRFTRWPRRASCVTCSRRRCGSRPTSPSPSPENRRRGRYDHDHRCLAAADRLSGADVRRHRRSGGDRCADCRCRAPPQRSALSVSTILMSRICVVSVQIRAAAHDTASGDRQGRLPRALLREDSRSLTSTTTTCSIRAIRCRSRFSTQTKPTSPRSIRQLTKPPCSRCRARVTSACG